MRRLGRKHLVAAVIILTVSGLAPERLATAQTLTTLYTFQGHPDGVWPSGLVRDPKGRLYGTTLLGGRTNYGTVYRLSKSGKETVLHSFHDGDGQEPRSSVLRDSNGDLYGTTIYGGYNEYGTVFKIHGTAFTVLHKFQGAPDGQGPFAGVVQGAGASFYGTTAQGGTGLCGGGCGTIFEINNLGQERVLHSFTGPDGAYPSSELIRDDQGNFYGTTDGGGGNGCKETGGCGTVFKFDKDKKVTLLHTFGGGKDGSGLVTAVFRDARGNVYGTTLGGGLSNMGTVFKITAQGRYKVLHSFQGIPDGATPAGPLAQAANGDLFGVTNSGGSECDEQYSGCGTVYKVDKSGNASIVYRFNGITDGAAPQGSLAFDSEGNIYGVTVEGPWDGCTKTHAGCGTIWKLKLNGSTQ